MHLNRLDQGRKFCQKFVYLRRSQSVCQSLLRTFQHFLVLEKKSGGVANSTSRRSATSRKTAFLGTQTGS